MDTATTEIYTYLHTLSLHDALPISRRDARRRWRHRSGGAQPAPPASAAALGARDRRARPPRRASPHPLAAPPATSLAARRCAGRGRGLPRGGSVAVDEDRKSAWRERVCQDG